MQFGFNLPLSGPSASPAMLARLAAEGEAIGYDYAAISDHIVEPIDIHARYPYSESGEFPAGSRGERHEQLTAIAYLAAKTSRRQRRAVPVLRQQRRDHRRLARHARARGKGNRLQFRRAHCRRPATVPRGGRRQIVSEEGVHMLACNWRLQRLFAFELRRRSRAKRAECVSASSNSAPAR